MSDYQNTLNWAKAVDADDPLACFRERFCIPPHGDGEQVYLCGNSLGLQPRALQEEMDRELADWRQLAVEGHFRARHPWMPYHELLTENLATVFGAKPIEIVAMNSLTVNLHLMMVSFFRPQAERNAILIEKKAFPSDRYAVESQLQYHGIDPKQGLIELAPSGSDPWLRFEELEACLEQHGDRIALILWPGVQYFTGQRFDLAKVAELGRRHGCVVGFDLAHSAGNVPVNLHDSGADFAVWCSYKYMNSGPGAVAGCFVHERHAREKLLRFAGWWGHDKDSRFKMGPEFHPIPGAEGWQLSNPPIMALAPVRVSLDIFVDAGIERLREKSLRLTGYMEWLIRERLADRIEIFTPSDPEQRGCQLSLRLKGSRDEGRQVFETLTERGIVCDWREPDVIRAAPTPLYNRFSDVFQFVEALDEITA